MQIQKLDEIKYSSNYTALLYCAPGGGKSTAIGLIAEASEGNTLVLDIDRTITKTLAKEEVVKDTSKILTVLIDTQNTFDDWTETLKTIATNDFIKKHNIRTIAVDNISELERCLLSDLGSKGKNKGVPAMADYQYMQFKLVNSLRFMKTLGVNIVWTAWETVELRTRREDGSQYNQWGPKISSKIVDNICGLCDVVGKIYVNKDGEHVVFFGSQQDVISKNQIDSRKDCKVEDFTKWEVKKDVKAVQ